MATKDFKTWDDYVKEAEKPPFLLKVSEDETLSFTAPSGAAMIQIGRAARSGDTSAVLELLSGENWKRVKELIGGAGFDAMFALAIDLQIHFGLTDEYLLVSPDGDKKLVDDPREVRSLMRKGWVVSGEARA